MQHNKSTKRNSQLEVLAKDSEKLTSSLTDVIEKFSLKQNLSLFDCLKSKGLAISSLLNILIILPFWSVASVYALFKSGMQPSDMQGKKDVYYNAKNNEFIDWRPFMRFHAKRFIYLINNNINLKTFKTTALIFDDTLLEKTGRTIEKVSYVFDHVSKRSILGYKLLVCGFWDGGSFIPLDFSLHRERGNKHTELIKEYRKSLQKVEKQIIIVSIAQANVDKKQIILTEKALKFQNHATQTNAKQYTKAEENLLAEQSQLSEKQSILLQLKTERDTARKSLKRYYSKERIFGLTKKERDNQFKKAVSSGSFGFVRRKEADLDKISSMLQILARVVKHGFIADYVLTDSWFFCYELLEKLAELKAGAIKLVSMVRIHNQVFKLCSNDKEMSVKKILHSHKRQAKRCKKYKTSYIEVKCTYEGLRLNLFFVKMGKSDKWHLLATTDLNLKFIELLEVYQIRWTIEIFFKESKQYLHLGDCQSTCFDSQIADLTISMLQHIMLSYCKRINYQQSIGDLFKSISNELVELDLVSRLLEIFWELVKLLCECAGIDFIVFQSDVMRNDKILSRYIDLFPKKVLDKAA